jgi:uncharacterized membrane protein
MEYHRQANTKAVHFLLEGLAVWLLAVLITALLYLIFTRPPISYARQAASLDETVKARVLQVLDESSQIDENGLVQVSQTLTLEILSRGTYYQQQVTITYNGLGPSLNEVHFKAGEQALVMVSQRPDGEVRFAVADHVRHGPLLALSLLLVAVTILVGRGQGVRALVGLALSGLLIGGFVLPQILAHRDPVWVAIVGTALLLAVTLYLIQGWNSAAHAALLGMVISLGLTGALAYLWARLAYLTGFGSEETMYLQAIGVGVQMRGLLLAGMIIGAAGVLDDVVLAQAVTAFTLAEADPTLPARELYRRAMKVGVTHLASMINTLVLAYAGTALPLMILFYLFAEPWYLTLNRELLAEEIVRTLVGSLGLMVAVPLTSFIAAQAAAAQHPTVPAGD